MQLTNEQYSRIAEFCNGVAIGLFLGVIITPAIARLSIYDSLLPSIFRTLLSLLFLYLSLIFSKKRSTK